MNSLLKILSDALLQRVESILGRGLLFHAVAGLVLFIEKLRIQIYEAFNKAKIEIALPQQIIHMRERKR